MLEPSAFEAVVAIEKLKRHKSPDIYQIPPEIIEVEGRTIRPEIHKQLILSGIRRNCLRIGRSRSMYLFTKRAEVNLIARLSHIPVGVPSLSTKFRNSLFREVMGTLSNPSPD